ncbi:MAG TPA: glycosyltransferase family 87 protein [Micromonospora sp.]
MTDPAVDNPAQRDPEPDAAERTRPGRRFRRPSRPDLLAIGAYVLLGIYVCVKYWVDVEHRVSSHLPTDHSWFEWLLSHGAYSVQHLENPLFSMRQNAPDGVNMMANTSVLGISLPLAPVTMLFGPQVAYSVYLGLALAATAGTSYWMLSRHLVTSRAAAFVGGAFLGFAPGIIHHANGQPNFASNFLLPLILTRVLLLGRPGRRWWRDGLVLGLLVAYQVFVNEEMLLLTALACAVVVPVYALARRTDARARWKGFLASLGLGAAVTLLLTGYPIWYQFNGPQSYRGLQGGVFHSWGEDLWAFVTFSRDTLAGSPAVEKTIGLTEQNTWFGWPLVGLTLLVIVLLWRVSLATRIAAVLIAVFTFASIGPQVRVDAEDTGIAGPWAYVPDDLPLVEMMMPTRLSLVVAGAIGVLLALAWDQVATTPTGGDPARRRVRILAYGAIGLALLPIFPRPLPAMHVDAPPRFITSGAWQRYVPEGRTLVPVPVPSNVHGLSTLRWSALTGHAFPVPGGYFIGPGPDGAGIFGAAPRPTSALIYATMDSDAVPPVTEENRRAALDDLRYWRASVVVLGAGPDEAVLRQLLTELLGPGQRVDDVWLWDVRSRLG